MDLEETDSLSTLPTELVHLVFLSLKAHDAARLASTCKRFQTVLSDQKLWRHYIMTDFTSWNDMKLLRAESQKSHEDQRWRRHYIERASRERRTRDTFEHLLIREYGRHDKIADVATCAGIECQATLQPDICAKDGLEDTLCRRYWARKVVQHARKRWAVDQWTKESSPPVPILWHPVVVGFDAFMPGRTFNVDVKLMQIARGFRQRHPDFEHIISTPEKIKLIIDYLRDNHYLGTRNIANYHALHNNFISHALFDDFDSRSSMPLVSNMVFAAVCMLLKIWVTLCNFPGHVYSAVWRDTEGGISKHSTVEFYVDPWKDNETITYQEMLSRHRTATGDGTEAAERALRPMHGHSVLTRMIGNITQSINQQRAGNVEPDENYPIDEAEQATWWCQYLTTAHHRPLLISKISYMLFTHPEDLAIVESITPIDVFPYDYPGYPNRGRYADMHGQPVEAIAMIAEEIRDNRPSPIDAQHRTDAIKYRVGQVFRHRRYGYKAVIVGWDGKCEESEAWQTQMGIAQLSKGADQPYYNAVVEDDSRRYVAQENIEIVKECLTGDIMPVLGEYFKRWDGNRMEFVSNMTERYPDD